jgi:hypothetical protein
MFSGSIKLDMQGAMTSQEIAHRDQVLTAMAIQHEESKKPVLRAILFKNSPVRISQL